MRAHTQRAPRLARRGGAEVDESHIPEYRIMHQARAEVTWENHRYPFAGAANPKVRLGVVDVTAEASAETFAPQWLDLGEGAVRACVLGRGEFGPIVLAPPAHCWPAHTQ